MQPDPPQVELQMLLLSEHPLKVRRRALQANMVGSNNHGVYIFLRVGIFAGPDFTFATTLPLSQCK